MKLGGELLPFLLEKRFYRPIFDRLESFHLALTLDEQSKRNRLNATG